MKINFFKILFSFTVILFLFSIGCTTTTSTSSKDTASPIIKHHHKNFQHPGYYHYKTTLKHEGGDVTPSQAYEMVLNNPKNTFIIDVRTPAEYAFIGHPTGSYNIPLKFLSNEIENKKGSLKLKMPINKNFAKDLLSKFNPATDTLIFMCRSGKRSCISCDEAIKVGFPKENLFNMLGGFQGNSVKNKHSKFHGERKAGGWVNEGLPWDYKLDPDLAYMPSK